MEANFCFFRTIVGILFIFLHRNHGKRAGQQSGEETSKINTAISVFLIYDAINILTLFIIKVFFKYDLLFFMFEKNMDKMNEWLHACLKVNGVILKKREY